MENVQPAPANPMAVDPLPEGWPSHGTLDGKPIDLMLAKRTLPPGELCDIEVEVPGQGVIRPWRGSDYGIDEHGNIVL